jgi:hypothetical protein
MRTVKEPFSVPSLFSSLVISHLVFCFFALDSIVLSVLLWTLMLRRSIGILLRALAGITWVVALAQEVGAESPGPSVHWGAISYPDQARLLETGLTLNRFTEFNSSRSRYNAIHETSGFNFGTVSWTEHLKQLPGWSTNLTVGAGPTRDDPTNALQNRWVHRWLGFDRVPVGSVREATDFMIDGSLTRWFNPFGAKRTGFIGGGVSLGSLYQEVFARIGVRRLSLASLAGLSEEGAGVIPMVLRSVRVSAMGRYSRLSSSAAYDEVAPQSYLGQISLSVGDYSRNPFRPSWELEFAYTIDSGLFVSPSGKSIEEHFGSVALRIGFVTFESWNDTINGRDFGPTYGGRFMIDLFYLGEVLGNRL